MSEKDELIVGGKQGTLIGESLNIGAGDDDGNGNENGVLPELSDNDCDEIQCFCVEEEISPLENFINNNDSIRLTKGSTEDEKKMWDEIINHYKNLIIYPKEKELFDYCMINRAIDSNSYTTATFKFWKFQCYMDIKKILKTGKDPEYVLGNIINTIDNYRNKMDYDAIKTNIGYNGKKLEIKLMYDYLCKRGSFDIELFVTIDKPYSDVWRINSSTLLI